MEYLTEILIAALALAGSAIGSFSGFRLTAYRVEQLEKKVDRHNHFAERVPVLEDRHDQLRSMLAEVNRRLDEMEKTERKG